MDPLKRVENELKKCVKCGACRANCPAFSAFQREPAVARGKVALAQHLLAKDIELDDSDLPGHVQMPALRQLC